MCTGIAYEVTQAVSPFHKVHRADATAGGREVCSEGLGLLAADIASSNPTSGMDVCTLSLHVWTKAEILR
jgi:calcineurin-like phosphoesterase